ncbi:hypothetical protein ACJIZ3_025831 [Penstemon smallii]|uniref:Uncharacterized protein n=1 Tax=Penstemon smallii TaxID=265156 RepID=A0ABD3TYB6_9LAMI
MLLHGITSTKCLIKCLRGDHNHQVPKRNTRIISLDFTRFTTFQPIAAAAVATAAAVLVLSAGAIEVATPQQPEETLSNIPQTLSSVCTPEQKDCKKSYRIQRPKSRKAEKCTSKCAGTCLLGGFGAPGEGPFNIRSLSECSDICNLIGDGDDGP